MAYVQSDDPRWELSVASLKWLLSDERFFEHAVRALTAVDEDDENFDGQPVSIMARLSIDKLPLDRAIELVAYARGIRIDCDYEPPLSIDDIDAYEKELRKELQWAVAEKKKRVEELAKEDE